MTTLHSVIASPALFAEPGNPFFIKKSWLIFIALLLCSPIAHATSFNCLAKALKPFEKQICFNQTLSALDEQVNSYYEDALKVSPNRDRLKSSQQTYMKRRKACQTSDCLQDSYESAIKNLQEELQTSTTPNSNTSVYPIWISPLLAEPDLKSCENKENADDIMCKALRIMKTAKPARASAVKDFTFTDKSIEVLPDLLRLGGEAILGGASQRCFRYLLNLSHVPISQGNLFTMGENEKVVSNKNVEQVKIVSTIPDKSHLLLDFLDKNTARYRLDIKILGRGDLLDTGWENLLLQVISTRPSNGYSNSHGSNLFILTRKKDTDVFQVAHPEQYLSTKSGDGSVMCSP